MRVRRVKRKLHATEPPEDLRKLAELVRHEREAGDLTQEELALRAGLSVQQIRRVEAASSIPSAILIARIAKVLRKPSDHFLKHVRTGEEILEDLWVRHDMDKKVAGMQPGKLDLKAKKYLLETLGYLKKRRGKRLI